MKKKLFVLLAVLVLILASLACGSSNGDLEDAVEELGDASEDLQEAVEEALGDASEDLQEEVEEALGNGGDSVDEPETEEEIPEVGTARSNPAPVGSEVIVDDMAFVVLGTTRPADDIIVAGNQFNTEPESDQEYILVELQLTCKKSSDEECSISSFWNISLIGSSGVAYDAEFAVVGVEGLLESVDFYGDATVSGTVPFIINQSETDLVLIYEPILFGDTMYLALPEPSQP